MRFTPLAALFLAATALPALAQAWSAGDPGLALLPAPASGPAADGAALACQGGAWTLTIPGTSGAVAMLVDGRLFPGNAENGAIPLPPEAVEALKAGSKFTLNIGGTEWAFALSGSRRAIEAAAASCSAAPAEAAAAPEPAPEQEPVTLSAPATVEAMTKVTIGYTGTPASGDWVTFAVPGSTGADFVANAWAFTEGANPVTVTAPGQPGPYELRYVTADYRILVSLPVEVTPSTAVLPDAAALTVTLPVLTVKAGQPFPVDLAADAPRQSGEYLYITPVDAPEQDYSGGFTAVPTSGPATLTAPATPGAWELRYMVPRGDGTYSMIGRAALTVE